MQAIVHPDGRLVLGGLVFRAALGRAGVTDDKREGDGATPAGQLPLRRAFYRADRVSRPDCNVPVEPIALTDGWCGVLGWNDAPVRRERGSAIFLHVARPDYAPTEGCVALALGDLQRVLAAGLTELLVLPS